MNKTMKATDYRMKVWTLAAVALLAVGIDRAAAQAPSANVPDEATWTALTPAELEALVGPIALYPDDLLAVVLPASTFPLQVVQASRYLEARESNPELQPDAEWDDSIVALLNYPEALALLNDDLDWTYELGEAVVYQQGDVLNAVQDFRGQAQNAGNLASDDRQVVAVEDDGAISISPADPEVIYVPYYDPARVVVHQHVPAYFYYPYGYPVYYYPYPYGYSFRAGLFWGVTSAFLVSWHDHYLHVRHHSHFGHPYYGYSYYDPWYARTNVYVNVNHYGSNYLWRPSYHDGGRPRHYAGFSRLRDRSYVRAPAERRIRSGWVGTNRNDGNFRTPRRDAAPVTVDEQRARRIRSGRDAATDLQVNNRATRTREVNSGSGRLDPRTRDANGGSSGRLDPRTRDVNGSSERLDPRTRDVNGSSGRFDPRTRDVNGSSGRFDPRTRAAGGNRGSGNATATRERSGRVARALPQNGTTRDLRPQALGQARGQAFDANGGRRAQPSGAALGRTARTSRLEGQPRALGGNEGSSRGTLGRIAPQGRAQQQRMQPANGGARIRSGVGREQPMSAPPTRATGRSVERSVAPARASGGQNRAATRSGGSAQPRNAGGAARSAGGGRAPSANRSNRRAR